MKYTGNKTKEIVFPLGGIGSGSIGLGGDGRLKDWEIFNRPNKGSDNGCTHFAIRAIDGKNITAAVLNSDINKEFMGQYKQVRFRGYGYGPDSKTMCGFPHFRNVVFDGEFPVATIDFKDNKFPADVKMTAFNPFIPLDEDNSSIPAAFFEFEIENTSAKDMKYQIAFSVANPYENSVNKSGENKVCLFNNGASKDDTSYGELCVATDSLDAVVQTYWYRGRWMDSVVSFWNEFTECTELKDRIYDEAGKFDTSTVIAEVNVKANQKGNIRFVLSWYMPNNCNYWSVNDDSDAIKKPWKNYYAKLFESAENVADYSLENWDSLKNRTFKFKDALFNSTLPEVVIDAASANLSVLKSPTVLRLEDGSFYGWEGVHEKEGSCEGTCQHVWNYAYALCFLFPRLEKSIRDMMFKYSTDENGRTGFRIMIPVERGIQKHRACLDGQMGEVIKSYREWKISGDNKWLEDNWETLKKILEYAWSEKNYDCWDRNKDGVLEGRQHHTLDMELFGPSSWLQGMYLAALTAASEMAEFLGEHEKAHEYKELFEKGQIWTKENLFNGEYFVQKINLSDKNEIDKYEANEMYWNEEQNQIKYQIAEGSSIDQVLGQWHADILGLGEIFDGNQLNIALDSMMKYNFKESMRDFTNPWRIFAVNDESGSVICVYPENSDKPGIPVPYCEECMTGFEYSFAGILCSRGKVSEGVKVVKAVRNRFDGEKRNPWNEFECGSNYARSMASYALVPILSGFKFDMPNRTIGFNPYEKGDFKCIWSLGSGWGEFEISGNQVTVSLNEGSLKLQTIELGFAEGVKLLEIDEENVDFTFCDGKISFKETNVCDYVKILL